MLINIRFIVTICLLVSRNLMTHHQNMLMRQNFVFYVELQTLFQADKYGTK